MRIDLVSDADAITMFELFHGTSTLTDTQILNFIDVSYFNIADIFGTFRCFKETERTVRKNAVVRALIIEASALATANLSGIGTTTGTNTGAIKSEKIGNITTTYKDNDDSKLFVFANNHGLLTADAARILMRYVRKFHMWSEPQNGYC